MPNATTHEFTVYLSGVQVLSDDAVDALFAAGCDDATPVSRDGKVFLDFARQAEDYDAAVATAVCNIRAAGFQVARIESRPEAVAAFRAKYEAWAAGLGTPVCAPSRGGRGCGTSAIGDLMRGIKIFWPDMDDSFRTFVRQHFNVREVQTEFGIEALVSIE
jgi:hypothetical protein